MVWGFSVVDALLQLDSIFFLSPVVCQNHFNKSQHPFSMIPTNHTVLFSALKLFPILTNVHFHLYAILKLIS